MPTVKTHVQLLLSVLRNVQRQIAVRLLENKIRHLLILLQVLTGPKETCFLRGALRSNALA